MTQDQVAPKLRTKKAAISKMENHAEDIALSRIQRYAKVIGQNLRVEIYGLTCQAGFGGVVESHSACS